MSDSERLKKFRTRRKMKIHYKVLGSIAFTACGRFIFTGDVKIPFLQITRNKKKVDCLSCRGTYVFKKLKLTKRVIAACRKIGI